MVRLLYRTIKVEVSNMKKIIISEKEIEAEYQLLSKLFPPKKTHCKIDRDVMPKIAESGKGETISLADV